MQIIHTYLARQSQQEAFRRTLYQTLLILSLLVTVGVFWGLKLTGITMAGEAFCGYEEHSHGEGCIQQTLICEIPEVQAHAHSEACLEQILQCVEDHSHEDGCYILEEDRYTCGLEETQGHTHEDNCYEILEGCPLEEHIHQESCYSDIKIISDHEIHTEVSKIETAGHFLSECRE